MSESNIIIKSNIYIRSNPDIRKDRQYTEKITGAKRLREIKGHYVGLASIPFTPIQNEIVKGNQRCSYARNGEMSYGPVMVSGNLRWLNRCEYIACPGYNGCRPQNISRNRLAENVVEEEKSLQDFFEKLGIIINDDTIEFKRDRNTAKTEESPKEYTAPTEQVAKEILEAGREYVEITEPDCIISAPLDSHIILNSGPGTGKTYTIIQRLIYILANDLCPADEIYILCYTRSAKKVVESKINQAVSDGIIQPSAKNICVLTFDSYATYFLMAMREQGVIKDNFDNYDYNARIKLFNEYVTPEDFKSISYFIVDEIQDLVNERAEMVLNILKNLNCGYLLAGDRCQAIYDYAADDDATLDSVKFYELAENLFPNDMLRYEITVNRRQSSALASESAKLRHILLNETIMEQNRQANSITAQFSSGISIEKYIKTLTQAPSISTAILCRTNGEAEYISGLLCVQGIAHTLNRGVNNVVPLPRWIADIFWDYCRDTISRNDFLERFCFRCDSKLNSEILWELLCKLTLSPNTAEINVSSMMSALSIANNVPSDFFGESPLLTVSTIHKAKGSEYDRVILIDSGKSLASSESAEEARVRYVALTRPKSQFVIMRENTKYFKRTQSGRIIETGLHYRFSNKYCKSITVGLTGDVDHTFFVSGDFESALDLQEYIINNIKLYDKLSAIRSDSSGLYEIFHNGRFIGALSKRMIDELEMGISSTDYKYNLPDGLENLYVSGITTEVLKRYNVDIPIEYQKSKLCYGIQITGLARLVFGKK